MLLFFEWLQFFYDSYGVPATICFLTHQVGQQIIAKVANFGFVGHQRLHQLEHVATAVHGVRFQFGNNILRNVFTIKRYQNNY